MRIKFFAAILLGGALLPAAQNLRGQESGPAQATAVVKPHAYVSLEAVPRGKTFEVAVVAEIASGYHMNSNKPLDEFLIPTTLTVQPASGLKTIEIVYPEGRLEKFSFSPDKPLSVYSGSVTLRARVQAAADAPLGPQKLSLTLRYQACNDAACLPPVKIPISAELTIAPAGTRPQPQHPEIFSSSSAQRRK